MMEGKPNVTSLNKVNDMYVLMKRTRYLESSLTKRGKASEVSKEDLPHFPKTMHPSKGPSCD